MKYGRNTSRVVTLRSQVCTTRRMPSSSRQLIGLRFSASVIFVFDFSHLYTFYILL
jgi:hypothetical protein